MDIPPSPAAWSVQTHPRARQCADAVLMVRPARFGYNPQTALTNAFQRPAEGPGVGDAARAECDALASALAGEGVRVCLIEDTPEPAKPDAVFPNNWVSFHADGTVVLYPMQAPSRRAERRREAIDAVSERLGYRVSRVLDLTHHERQGRFLEGTGSLVLDHRSRLAFACRSPRTDTRVLAEWARELDYEPVVFDAADRAGTAIYHTNVLMSIGERLALLGSEAIAQAERGHVQERLRSPGREVIDLDHGQIERFAGNVLELATWDEALGEYRVLVMSESARRALPEGDFARISACTDEVLCVPVPTIERLGGGSVRCMLAEVFLPS
ncbi:MAG: citrulline utilization hydrolase CtlX [Steroidobacteraceae bacterium]